MERFKSKTKGNVRTLTDSRIIRRETSRSKDATESSISVVLNVKQFHEVATEALDLGASLIMKPKTSRNNKNLMHVSWRFASKKDRDAFIRIASPKVNKILKTNVKGHK